MKLESAEPPPPVTEHGYPVRFMGRVVRYHKSKQVHANTIDPCPSSLNEVARLERVIEFHKTKYSLSVPFVLPPKVTSHTSLLDKSIPHAVVDANASVFSNNSHTGPGVISYTFLPPPIPEPVQSRSPSPLISRHLHFASYDYMYVPSSPMGFIHYILGSIESMQTIQPN